MATICRMLTTYGCFILLVPSKPGSTFDQSVDLYKPTYILYSDNNR